MLVGLATLLGPVTYTAEAESEPPPEPEVIQIRVIRELPDILLRIADCESGKRDSDGRAVKGSGAHYDTNGDVILGKLNKPEYGVDIGKFQVNEFFHGERAKRLGLDLYDEHDNAEYALRLYEEQGVQPWSASRSCWQ